MAAKNPTRVAAGFRAALVNPKVSNEAKENALRQLDGFTNAHAPARKAKEPQQPQHRVQEDDDQLDEETLRNTRANERTLRVQQEEGQGHTEADGQKHMHVNFMDENASQKLVAHQKGILRSSKATKAAKVDARDFLQFHGAK